MTALQRLLGLSRSRLQSADGGSTQLEWSFTSSSQNDTESANTALSDETEDLPPSDPMAELFTGHMIGSVHSFDGLGDTGHKAIKRQFESI